MPSLDNVIDPSDVAPEDAPERLAKALGLTFKNIELLRLALTHRSVLHDWQLAAPELAPPLASQASNERLEFLGDAALGYVVADYLYRRYPAAPEGLLTAKRAGLVRAERLVTWARDIDLGSYLYLGQGDRVTENRRDRMLAGAFEAIVGAIAVDSGLRVARKFILSFVSRDEAEIVSELGIANPKGRLQELIQEHFRLPPVYRTLNEEGPAHARTFTSDVSILGETLGVGVGGSKREAEQNAATAALEAWALRPPAVPEAVTVRPAAPIRKGRRQKA